MKNSVENGNSSFRKNMRKLIVGPYLGLELAAGVLGVSSTATAIENLNQEVAFREQVVSWGEQGEFLLPKIDQNILIDEIIIALLPLTYVGIASAFLYGNKVYNDRASLPKPLEKTKAAI